jgi:hypothetical protein
MLYEDIAEDIIAAEPACMKIVGDGQELAMFSHYYDKLSEKTIFIARPWSPTQKIGADFSTGKDPSEAADEYDKAISYLIPYLPRAYWDGWNEPGHPSQEIERWLGLFDERRVENAIKGDYGVACAAWSEGAPNVPAYDNGDNSYERYLPALKAMHKAGPRHCIMTQHEYARQKDGGFLTQPWRIGRINEVYKYLENMGIGDIWTVLGEYGRDAPKWKEMGLSDEEYANELTSWEVQNRYHPKVIGRLIYTLDRDPKWQDMDIHGECFRLVNNYIKSVRMEYYPPMPWMIASPIEVPPPAPDPELPPDPVLGPNLLFNPGFEGGSSKITADWDVPNGWEPCVGDGDAIIHYEVQTHPPDVKVGNAAARVWQSESMRAAGLMQDVPAEVGAEYQFAISGKAWSTNDAMPGRPSDADIAVKIGIDPNGGSDPLAPDVIWCPDLLPRDEYADFVINAVAKAATITCYTLATPRAVRVRSDVFFDGASLRKTKDAPISRIGVKTTDSRGQYVRRYPSKSAEIVGDLEYSEIGYISIEEASGIGQPKDWPDAWVNITTANATGWALAPLLVKG